MKKIIFLFVILASCTAKNNTPPQIVTGIAPVADLIQQIVGDELIVAHVIPVGSDPHIFNLKPSDAQQIEQAELVIGLHDHIDGEVLKATDKVVFMVEENEEESDNGHDHDHAHDHDNPHIWVAFTHSQELIDELVAILQEQYPAQKDLYAQNGEKIKKEIQQLYEVQSTKTYSKAVIQRHPAWNYIFEELNVQDLGVLEEFEGEQPSIKRINDLILAINDSGKDAILIDDAYASESSALQQIANDTGNTVVRFNPMVAPSGSSRVQDILKEYTDILAQ